MFDDTPSYHTLHRILNVENGAWHMKGMEFHFIEMPKLKELHKWPVTGLEHILYYLGSMGGESEMQTLEKEDGRVAKMRQLEKIFRSDPDLVREYQQREQDKLDYQISLDAREERGRTEGRAEGEARGILKTLAGLIHKGLLSLKDAALEANMTEAEFTAQIAALGV